MGLPNRLPDLNPEPKPERRPTLQIVARGNEKVPSFTQFQRKVNARTLVTSAATHTLLVAILVLVPLLITDQINVIKHYATVELVKPPEPYQPPPPPRPKIAPPPLERLKTMPPPPPKAMVMPKPPEPKPPEIKREMKPVELPPVVAKKPTPPAPQFADARPDAEPGPKGPKPEIRTDMFSGSSAKPTLNLSPRQVQTGGFGDPNGLPGKGDPKKGVQIASVGSFDLPSGPGQGNGWGGAKGAKGTVASAGFGNGIATAGGGGGAGGAGRGGVRSGGFGDSTPAPAEHHARAQAAESPTVPVEILFKPKPVYTEEARGLKIEGEVLVEVQFNASGQVRVLNVKRGLGHGLDEAATRAAEQIRFKPARRDGVPVDSTAVVHIVFQMAY